MEPSDTIIGYLRAGKSGGRARRRQGFEEDPPGAVHAPIGIDIGAETLREIAVSIIAGLIKIRSAA